MDQIYKQNILQILVSDPYVLKLSLYHYNFLNQSQRTQRRHKINYLLPELIISLMLIGFRT